jgi:hypothetical protein
MGSYHVEAAIAAVHAGTPSVEATDWAAIVALCDRLIDIAASPVVAALAWRATTSSVGFSDKRLDGCGSPYHFAEGTSRVEIVGPCFRQPSRRSHVRGWYTTSGS